MLQAKLNNGGPYKASIGAIHLKLQELQETDSEAQKIRATQLQEGWDKVDGVLQYRGLSYVPEIIRLEVIICHHNDSLAEHFGIDKTQELIGWKYYWPSLRKNVGAYVWGCNMCLASKAICHKPYGDLQFLPVLTH